MIACRVSDLFCHNLLVLNSLKNPWGKVMCPGDRARSRISSAMWQILAHIRGVQWHDPRIEIPAPGAVMVVAWENQRFPFGTAAITDGERSSYILASSEQLKSTICSVYSWCDRSAIAIERFEASRVLSHTQRQAARFGRILAYSVDEKACSA